MDRNEFMELVYETFADEPDNVLANGIIEAADAYVEHEEAQLFREGATSDLISRQWLMECVNEGWIKFDTEKDANRFIHLVRDIAPTAQPVETDTNVGDMISRQAAIDALDFEIVHITAYRDGKNEGNPLAQYNKGLEDGKKAIEALPSAQPEPHEGHWIPHESPDGGEQYECSRCGVLWEFNDGAPEDNEAYFCPKCGKKMKGEPNE